MKDLNKTFTFLDDGILNDTTIDETIILFKGRFGEMKYCPAKTLDRRLNYISWPDLMGLYQKLLLIYVRVWYMKPHFA